MKRILVILIVVWSSSLWCQNADSTKASIAQRLTDELGIIEPKKEWPTWALMFVAGAADGLSQDLLFHYHEFERSTGATNHQYWNPDLSWRNKYRNGDPTQGAAFWGSTTFFVGLTDGYHACRSVRDLMVVIAIATSDKPLGKKQVAYRAFTYSLAYGAGFTLVYDVLIE